MLLPVKYQPDSHAANLLELDNGDLLCVWFNGPREGDPGTNVVLSRLPCKGGEWTDPMELAADPRRSEQNPVLFQAPVGVLWLLHTSTEPHDQTTSRVVVRRSFDRGATWTEPGVLFDRPGTFLRSPIVVLSNGSWLLPIYHCRPDGQDSAVRISADDGATWREYPVPESCGVVQMCVVERDDRTLLGLFRSRAADRIYASESVDLGLTWSRPVRTGLPNNDSSIQLTKLRNGHLALVYNDATLERDQFRWIGERKKPLRTPLTLAISSDGGRTWPDHRNVQMIESEYRQSEAGYSYPSIVQTSDGRLHIAYSFLRKAIKHVVVDEEWVREC